MQTSDASTAQRVTSFLANVRAIVQWQENMNILAPGDRTPYMDKVAFVATGLLTREIEGAEHFAVVCGARARPGKASIPSRKSREWLVKVDGQLFDMEGPVSEHQAKEQTTKRWLLGDTDKCGENYDVVVRLVAAGDVKVDAGMQSTDKVMTKLMAQMEGPLAAMISAPALADSTAHIPAAPTPARRF